VVVAALLGWALGPPAASAAPPVYTDEEQLLMNAKLGTDGPALLQFFRTRTRPKIDPEKMAELIRDLADDSTRISNKAIAQIISMGTVTVPWLRKTLKDPDDELGAQRAKFCLESIEGEQASAIPVAAIKTLANRRPEGAAKALVDYLPLADDDTVIEEIRDALASLAMSNGRPDKALADALHSRLPICRLTAAEALCQAKAGIEFDAVRNLLKDPKPTVRMRTAMALAKAKDQQAVQVLIDSLEKLPPDQAVSAEEVLKEIAGTTAPTAALGTDKATRKRCRDTWNTWWQSFKNPALLDYFRKRTLADADKEVFLAMVKKLGSNSYKERRKAIGDLAGYRGAAAPLLREATRSEDPEVARNAERCLKLISEAPGAGLSATHARILGFRKPPGSVQVLLGFLPFADDDTVAEEVRNSLVAMAFENGKPHRSLVAALLDKQPARRAVAAETLIQAGITGHKKTLLELLTKDPELPVRLRVAIALAGAREKQAVPVLIDLLPKLPEDDATRAEDILARLAGDQGPTVVLGTDAASKKKAQEAWAAWWKANGNRIDMAKLDTSTERLLGYTLTAEYTNFGVSQLVEKDKNGKERWKITGMSYSFDFQVLRGERVLIVEHNGNRVSERDFKGKVVWEVSVSGPVGAQRLPNGNTFVAGRNVLKEVNKHKKELYSISRRNYDVFAAVKLKNGRIAMITNVGMCVILDTKGKELKSFSVGSVGYYGCLEALPNGRLLVACYGNSKVVEYDQTGKAVWEVSAMWPANATRLQNGNTIVSSQNNNQILEFDRKGKQVSSTAANGQVWRVRRR
jgi:HEAT repeat protein